MNHVSALVDGFWHVAVRTYTHDIISDRALNIDIYNIKDPKSKEELADLLKQMDKLVILACEVDSNTINQVLYHLYP